MAERLNTELVVRLLANNRDFVAGMAQAVGEVRRFEKEVDRSSRAMVGFKRAAGAAVAGFGLLSAAAGGFIAKSTMVAARVEEMDGVLAQMGATAGISKRAVDEQVESIKDMGITTSVAQQVASQFIQSQLDFTKAARLARVAQDAAVLSQSNSSETLGRLIVAIQRYDTLMLRTLGLNINVAASQEALAAELGKSTKQLNESEKQQAVLNAVLEEGKTITGAYETAMGSARKQLGSLPRHIEDVEEAVGSAFVPTFFSAVTTTTNFVKAIKELVKEGTPLHGLLSDIGKQAADAIDSLNPFIERMTEMDFSKTVGQFRSFLDTLKSAAPVLGAIAAALGAQGLGSVLNLVPGLGGLAGALGALNPMVAGLLAMVAASEDAREALARFFGVVQELLSAALPSLIALIQTATRVVDELAPPIIEVATRIAEGMVPAVQGATSAIVVLLPVVEALATALGTLIGWVEKIPGGFELLGLVLVGRLIPGLGAATKSMAGLVGGSKILGGSLKSLWAVAGRGAVAFTAAFVAVEALSNLMAGKGKKAAEEFIDTLNQQKGVPETFDDLTERIDDLVGEYNRLQEVASGSNLEATIQNFSWLENEISDAREATHVLEEELNRLNAQWAIQSAGARALGEQFDMTARQAINLAEKLGVDLGGDLKKGAQAFNDYLHNGGKVQEMILHTQGSARGLAKVLGTDVAEAERIAAKWGLDLANVTIDQAVGIQRSANMAKDLGISVETAADRMGYFVQETTAATNAAEDLEKKASAVVDAFNKVFSAAFRARDAQRANVDATRELSVALAQAQSGFMDAADATRLVEDAAAAQTEAIFNEVMALVEAGHIARNYADIKGEMLRRISEVEAALPGMVDEVLSSARALDLARMATDQFSQAFADTVGVILSAEDATFAVEEKMRALGETFKELERQRGLKSAQEQLADARKELEEITKALNDFAGTQEDIDKFLENKGFRAVTETEKALKDLLVAQQVKKAGGKSQEDLLEAQKKAQERVKTATENVSDAQDDLNRLKDVAESQTRDVVRAIEREAIALVEAGRLGRDQNSILEFMKGRLADVGIEYPKVKTQIDRYVEAISKIPEKKPTKIKIDGMALVRAQLDEVAWLIDTKVPKAITIQTSVDTSGITAGAITAEQAAARQAQAFRDNWNTQWRPVYQNMVALMTLVGQGPIAAAIQGIILAMDASVGALPAAVGGGGGSTFGTTTGGGVIPGDGGVPATMRAMGGFITRPELALIGEKGPELILPLSDPSRTSQLLAAAGLGGGAGSMVHVTVTLDGKVVAETIVDPVVDSIYERERAMS